MEHQRVSCKPFFDWAKSSGRMPRLNIPATPARPGQPLTQHRRLQILRKLLTDNAINLRLRLAFTLLLLYGQPLSRVVRLTIDDVITTVDGVSIRFGEPPTPVPEPFAGLVLELIDKRTNMRTAANPNSHWLFPGRRAGQPLRPETLGQQSAKNGIPTITGRVPPCGNWSCRHRRRSSPTRSASTTPPPTGIATTRAAPGTATHQATTTAERCRLDRPEYRLPEYRSLPVRNPTIRPTTDTSRSDRCPGRDVQKSAMHRATDWGRIEERSAGRGPGRAAA
ncbi:hypothetical protein AB0M45_32335 [Nocardia sp. NPDC051787]|uniref:hypothetical protein n=1 Tax=Nocardia sp. NPDC051787 TaxID=3155415 RepID=UPI003437B839